MHCYSIPRERRLEDADLETCESIQWQPEIFYMFMIRKRFDYSVDGFTQLHQYLLKLHISGFRIVCRCPQEYLLDPQTSGLYQMVMRCTVLAL